ncbi:S9 family peptidase, partial [bacterium]
PVTKLAELSADEDAAYAVAPDGTLAVVRSSPARPAELWVAGKQVTQTPTEEWLSYPWIEAPIVQVPARDGQMIPAKLYKPKRWRKGGPAVIFVHGAGYLQNVYEGWSHYFREMMFNHLLMSKGYAVLDMDFRASAGYGKAWRTAIYRNMGGKDLDDNVDGARWLVKELGVNPKRIGLYGGSYGGFLTLMAMFKEPDVFAAGAALRPVTDWRSYHGGYTSPILNDPQDDPEAYRRSSPINFAEGLKGSLLICHGMVDVNVHFQDSVRLYERLIQLGKKDFTLAPYPVEDHAFVRPESWTDEYSRILALFDRVIGPGWKK